MPQLPSGMHVSVTIDPVLNAAGKGDFMTHAVILADVKSLQDFLQLVAVVYYPCEDSSNPGAGCVKTEPVLSGLTAADVLTEKCRWSEKDKIWFVQWLDSESIQHWLAESYREVCTVVERVIAELP
ncbi:MAG: hypothetical protein MI864_24005 [Pseudomonadales bacterium]|nr:hypothetical protein [Pseudomonadales bacterium]